MKNYHIIEVKYLGATNTKGSRVKLYSARFNQTKIISYNYSLNNIGDMAIEWLKSREYTVIGSGEGKSLTYIITDTFKPFKV
jgi:hypothetical protein